VPRRRRGCSRRVYHTNQKGDASLASDSAARQHRPEICGARHPVPRKEFSRYQRSCLCTASNIGRLKPRSTRPSVCRAQLKRPCSDSASGRPAQTKPSESWASTSHPTIRLAIRILAIRCVWMCGGLLAISCYRNPCVFALQHSPWRRSREVSAWEARTPPRHAEQVKMNKLNLDMLRSGPRVEVCRKHRTCRNGLIRSGRTHGANPRHVLQAMSRRSVRTPRVRRPDDALRVLLVPSQPTRECSGIRELEWMVGEDLHVAVARLVPSDATRAIGALARQGIPRVDSAVVPQE
jgi:hypothetical protein